MKACVGKIGYCVLLAIIAIIGVLIIQFAVSTRTPVKYAVKMEDLTGSGVPYYLVQWVQVTGSSWEIVGDQYGYYPESLYIIAEGETPSAAKNYSVAIGQNTYVCYGEYVGECEIPESGMVLGKYKFTDWDILFPIKRETVLPSWFYSSNYLSEADFE